MRWFGHIKRMNDERIVKRAYESEEKGRRDRGRQNRVWMDGVRIALNNREMTLEQARITEHDRVR